MTVGFFNLREPRDLLAKLRRDRTRMNEAPVDACPAFDFFVTATHLADWHNGGDEQRARAMVDSEPLLRACRRIANGAKHFVVRKQGGPVRSSVLEGGAFQGNVFQANVFHVGRLVVELDEQGDPEVARLLGSSVEARVLAAKVLAFWEEQLGVG